MKEILLKDALRKIPMILGMIDRNKYSKTYGCFDRQYWHYKKFDFPSGMYQLGILSLALVYKHKMPGNRWYKNERIKELCIAGIRYLEKGSHKDGTADEFYPYERALGATSFPLYTGTESYLMLGLLDFDMVKFFKKRADWLINNSEPSVIANHQFGAALALINVFKITREIKYQEAAQEKIDQGFTWGNEEGWFLEYEGCDPGYMTFSIDFLAKYYQKTCDDMILHKLKGSIEFCSHFIHPDGSYGGEYGSRNTGHYMPHGFELLGDKYPLALQMNDLFYEGLKNEKTEVMDDDTYLFYNVNNYLQAYIDYQETRPKPLERDNFSNYFSKAELAVVSEGDYYSVLSLAKGGTIKVFYKNEHLYSDCGFIGITTGGDMVTTQAIDDNFIEVNHPKIIVEGNFNQMTQILPTPFKQIIFRVGLIILGPSWKLGQLIKHMLIKKLITNKKKARIKYSREFLFSEKGVHIINEIWFDDAVPIITKLERLSVGKGYSVIQVPTSRYYQEAVVEPWIDLDEDQINKLNNTRKLEFEYVIKKV